MLIFGTRGVKSTVSTGEFYCPNCRQRTPYKRISVRQYGHLFFIPLIPLGADAEYIECQRCGTPFQVDVLQQDPDLLAKRASANYRRIALKTMEIAALADGEPNAQEFAAIRNIYDRLGDDKITEQQLADDFKLAPSQFAATIADLRTLSTQVSDQGRETLVRAALLVAASDGPILQVEYDVIEQIAEALHMTPAHYNGVLQTAFNSLNGQP